MHADVPKATLTDKERWKELEICRDRQGTQRDDRTRHASKVDLASPHISASSYVCFLFSA